LIFLLEEFLGRSARRVRCTGIHLLALRHPAIRSVPSGKDQLTLEVP